MGSQGFLPVWATTKFEHNLSVRSSFCTSEIPSDYVCPFCLSLPQLFSYFNSVW